MFKPCNNNKPSLKLITVHKITFGVAVNDVAIVHAEAFPAGVLVGNNVTINVTIMNKGNQIESFNVAVYYNITETQWAVIENKTVSDLAALEKKTLTFIWNTTGVTMGMYKIKAEADPVPNETDIYDNTFIDGEVTITLTVSKLPSIISLSVPPLTTVGSSLVINGSISPIRSGVNVTILYRLSGENVWNILANTTTNMEGQYSFTWGPSEPGTYEIKAKWEGDEKYHGDESDLNTVTVQEVSGRFDNLIYFAIAAIVAVVGVLLFVFLRIRRQSKRQHHSGIYHTCNGIRVLFI